MNDLTVAVIGLGYVGLPLAIEFGKKFPTIGFDLLEKKVQSYSTGIDPTGEVKAEDFKASTKIQFTSDSSMINNADVIIVAVPTPVDEAHNPDFTALKNASALVGKNLKDGAIIVYESTVYPGATEEICVPILEKNSNKKWQQGFNVGYSPERVNPGDKERTIRDIIKVVAGDNEDTLEKLNCLYGSIITAGVHAVSSIKVAEAAKVIENTQRDLNIALMNELAKLFELIDIDTQEVLLAAGTKWNFLPFKPGLVGGHCIGVDPYYLTHKAEKMGYHPQVILAGRRINDSMAAYVVQQTVKKLIHNGASIRGSKLIVLGLTFKENCADLRNSKVADVVKELLEFGCQVYVHDPIACEKEAMNEYQIKLWDWEMLPSNADAIVAAVSHNQYLQMPFSDLTQKLKPNGVFIDVKSAYNSEQVSKLGLDLWRL